jgi:tetratricopeptide (TPR) repeat protein
MLLHLRYPTIKTNLCMLLFTALFSLLFLSSFASAQPNQSISKADREKAAKLFETARVAYKAKEYTKALAGFEEAYRLAKEPLLLSNMGYCYLELSRYAEAQKMFKTFLDTAPADDPARAEVETALKQAEGRASFEDAESHYKLQEYDIALKDYAESYRITKAPEILFNIGQCYRQLNKPEEAIKSYKTYLREIPNAPNRVNVEATIAEMEAKLAATKVEPKTEPASLVTLPESTLPTTVALTKPAQEKSSAKIFYIGAGATGALGLVSGVLFLSANAQVKESLANNDSSRAKALEFQVKRAKALGTSSNVLFAAALVVGGAGFLVSKSNKKTELSLSLSMSSLSLGGTF